MLNISLRSSFNQRTSSPVASAVLATTKLAISSHVRYFPKSSHTSLSSPRSKFSSLMLMTKNIVMHVNAYARPKLKHVLYYISSSFPCTPISSCLLPCNSSCQLLFFKVLSSPASYVYSKFTSRASY